jgi:serine-type D-Ala-D-Ala carboxypeptidase (penicillin-binding protein 5/6)
MRRSVIATVMLVLAIEVIIVTVLLFFTPAGTNVLSALSPTPTPTPAPILTARGTPPLIKAGAIYLMDADTGHVLVNTNGQKRLPIASTTKIMTALLTIETANLDQMVTIHQDALDEVNNNGGSNAGLVVGDQFRLKDLLYAVMMLLLLLLMQ